MFAESATVLPDFFMEHFASVNTKWRGLEGGECAEYVLALLKRMDFARNCLDEEANRLAFETGWSENLKLSEEKGINAETLRPRYFRPAKFFRFAKGIVVPENHGLEYDLFTLSRMLIFHRYLKDFDFVYEFGCGSCGNLHLMSQIFADKSYVALDWAASSLDIAHKLAQQSGIAIDGRLFNFFRPDFSLC